MRQKLEALRLSAPFGISTKQRRKLPPTKFTIGPPSFFFSRSLFFYVSHVQIGETNTDSDQTFRPGAPGKRLRGTFYDAIVMRQSKSSLLRAAALLPKHGKQDANNYGLGGSQKKNLTINGIRRAAARAEQKRSALARKTASLRPPHRPRPAAVRAGRFLVADTARGLQPAQPAHLFARGLRCHLVASRFGRSQCPCQPRFGRARRPFRSCFPGVALADPKKPLSSFPGSSSPARNCR